MSIAESEEARGDGLAGVDLHLDEVDDVAGEDAVLRHAPDAADERTVGELVGDVCGSVGGGVLVKLHRQTRVGPRGEQRKGSAVAQTAHAGEERQHCPQHSHGRMSMGRGDAGLGCTFD